ncbi:hypothetical protein GCM10009678_62910 [Actinomadura kijaniata]|uniref:Integral membrane protein n=1 Tax=Actinomadura namibiensis TaxID=182080 RepID=A0A7W3LWL4_ACTNM|nr:hypothetical protein [Actinomadura namibiensis]MBA8955666.1 hypothetical protein [Actinomadura namibiensis]
MDLLRWLEQTAPAEAVRSTPWAYSSLEIVHLVGLALLVGPAVTFDLRLLGVGRRLLAVPAAARLLLPTARWGFALAAVSGAAMFASGAVEVAGSGAAPVKFALLGVALVNVLAFHRGVYRTVGVWGDTAPAAARAAAVVSLATWAGVVACGRLIAYT